MTCFSHNGKNYTVKIDAVICDAPARAFLKWLKTHNGYDSCERYVQHGEWLGKIVLPDLSASLRSDQDFIDQADAKHHVGSPFTQLECCMISGFPLDYMHLVCLGLVRRMIHLWLHGPLILSTVSWNCVGNFRQIDSHAALYSSRVFTQTSITQRV